jgi:hypothetical protein
MVKKYIVKGTWTHTYLAKDEDTAKEYANKMLGYLNTPNLEAEVTEVEEVQL